MRSSLLTIFSINLVASQAYSASVTFYFEDLDFDEVFDVFIEINNATGDVSTGLSTYNIALSGLDASPLDPATFNWTQNNLENFNAGFMPQGIQNANLLKAAVGTDGYSAANGQFNSFTPVFGIGVQPVFNEDNPIIPTDAPIDLDKRAFLGTLTLPGANRLVSDDFLNLLAPNAALFVDAENSADVVIPDYVTVVSGLFLTSGRVICQEGSSHNFSSGSFGIDAEFVETLDLKDHFCLETNSAFLLLLGGCYMLKTRV